MASLTAYEHGFEDGRVAQREYDYNEYEKIMREVDGDESAAIRRLSYLKTRAEREAEKTQRFRDEVDKTRLMYDSERDARKKLEGLITRLQNLLNDIPVCDKYSDEEAISCGWKSTVYDIREELNTFRP